MKSYTGTLVKEYYRNGLFVIGLLHTEKKVLLPNGKKGEFFKIKGDFESIMRTPIEIIGDWDVKTVKTSDPTFAFTSVSLIRKTDRNGAIAYLHSLRGVGDVTAANIYNHFGKDVFKVLDEDPMKLMEVKGISEKKAKLIATDYIARSLAKELFAYLFRYKMTESRIRLIYDQYEGEALNKVKTAPFSLYLEGLMSFDIAEKISAAEGLDPLSEDRIKAFIYGALQGNELRGHTYTMLKELTKKVLSDLKLMSNDDGEIRQALKSIYAVMKTMIGVFVEVDTVNGEKYVYRKDTYVAEHSIANNIKRLLRENTSNDYYDDIHESEERVGRKLSDEQELAVNTVLNNPLTVVTGGPGTGKTTFLSILLDTYQHLHRTPKIVLGAPTGRAARRMMQQTGLPARTLHSILKISVDDEGESHGQIDPKNDFTTADLIIVDEVSMLDVFLAEKVLDSIGPKCHVAFVGDIHQLPSVGAGAVLKSLIDSNCIPVCKFTKIFRQGDGSSIAQNALKINQGNADVVYDTAFQFLEVPQPKIADVLIDKIYGKAISLYGIDEVAVLTPYRKTTATGVNGLNPRLKGIFNPYEKASDTNKIKGMDIYTGDRVMFTRNEADNDLTNGDIGIVTNIWLDDAEQMVDILFDDGKRATLCGDSLKALVPAFATTVHKSQGSEYKCVIMIIDSAHKNLLKRNLIYTGVTRAKEKVILIGSKSAFEKGVALEDTNSRLTRLADLIKEA